MMIGRLPLGVLVGAAAGGLPPLGFGVAAGAGAAVGPLAGALVAPGLMTGGTGVGTVPGGTTAPPTSQPVTPCGSRTCRQIRPSTSRSGPSTSTGVPSASVFSTRPAAPGSERMLAPCPLVLPTCPREAGPVVVALVGRGAGAVAGVSPSDEPDPGALATGGGTLPSGTSRLAMIQPESPCGSRTLRQVWPSACWSGPTTCKSVPSGIVFIRSPDWPGTRRRLAPSPPVLPTWTRGPVAPGDCCGSGVTSAAGVGVAQIAEIEATVGDTEAVAAGVAARWSLGLVKLRMANTSAAVSATAAAATSPMAIHWARAIGLPGSDSKERVGLTGWACAPR